MNFFRGWPIRPSTFKLYFFILFTYHLLLAAPSNFHSLRDFFQTNGFKSHFKSDLNQYTYTKDHLKIVVQEYNSTFSINQFYYNFIYFPFVTRSGITIYEEDFNFLKQLTFLHKKKFKPTNKTNKQILPKNTSSILQKSNQKDNIDILFLDAGHGGEDPGATIYGFKEKDLTLKISQDLRRVLKKELPQTRIISTRKNDAFVSLEERCHLANSTLKEKQNGLFISIHLNTWFDPNARGFEVYYLSHQTNTTSARIHALVTREAFDLDKTSLVYLNPFDKIFGRLEVVQYQKESKRIGTYITETVYEQVKNYSVNRGVKSELFYVLKGALMPAVLIEIGFLSNQQDLEFITNEQKLKILLTAIAKGIKKYIVEFSQSNGFRFNLF